MAEQSLVPVNDDQAAVTMSQIDLERYREVMSIPTVVDLVAPMTLQEQMSAVKALPRPTAVETHPMGYQYISIGFVSEELDNIFGEGGNNFEMAPGSPTWERFDEEVTRDRVKAIRSKYVCMIHGWLIITWANGQRQRFEGFGEASYYMDNNNKNRAATLDSARSEAIKSAARRVGRRFGKGLRDAVKSGAINEISAADLDGIIQDAKGWRLVWMDGIERVVDDEVVTWLVKKYQNRDITDIGSMDERSKRNLVGLINKLPTLDDKDKLIARATQLGMVVPDGIKYSILRDMVRVKEDEGLNSIKL